MTALAALGAFAVPAGPALAQAAGDGTNAAGVQYQSEQQRTEQIAPQPPQPPQPPTPQQEVLPAKNVPRTAAEVTPVAQPQPQPAAAVPAGQLPFTGYDVMAVVAGGLTLLAAGLLLRRRTRGTS